MAKDILFLEIEEKLVFNLEISFNDLLVFISIFTIRKR
jgi:hypothetical protein